MVSLILEQDIETFKHDMPLEYEGLPRHTNRPDYTVPNVTYKSRKNQHIKVVTIGAGYAGILLAYKLEKISRKRPARDI